MKQEKKSKLGSIIGIIAAILFVGIVIYAFVKDDEANEYIIEKSYSEIEKIINKDEKSIILVGRDDCSHCISFRPTVVSVAKQYDIKVYYINTNTIKNEEDYNKLWNFIGTEGTPTIAITKGGNLDAVYEGTMTRSQLISFLKAHYL
jgi:predicted bacteriocin transport accessory protein